MRFSAILAAGIVVGCSSGIQQPSAPKDLIERDSIVVILRDLVVLESYAETRYQHVRNYHTMMSASGKACLKNFHIDPKRFERSYAYYVGHATELQKIYSEVLDSLNKEVNKLGAMESIQPDSAQQSLNPDMTDLFPGNR